MRYEYRPVRQNYNAHLAVVGCLLLSVGCFVSSAFWPSFAVIPQTIGVAILIPAIQLVAKYLVVQYLYRVCVREDGGVDLEIFVYRGGAKMQLVCCVGLDEITAAVPLTKQSRRAAEGRKRYHYCMDLAPERALVLSVTNADGECEVLLAPDERMCELLTPKKEQ